MTTDFDHPYQLAVDRFPTLRQSLLSSFDNCALSSGYEAEYRHGWSTHPQSRGQIFHRFAGACLRQMAEMREEQIPVDVAVEILRDVLRQDDIDRICPHCGTVDIELGIDEFGMRHCAAGHRFESELVNVPLAMVKDLHWIAVKWANDNAFDIQNLVDVEMLLKADLSYPNRKIGGMVPRTLTGTLDALFIEGAEAEHAVVIDWKDMWSVPAGRDEGKDDEVSFGGYFQQRQYGWLIFKRFPSVQKVTLREFYVRYSMTREASLYRDDVPEIESELSQLAERFDRAMNDWLSMPVVRREQLKVSGRLPFQPTPGKHCGYCLRPTACPIPQWARGEGRAISGQDAAAIGRMVIVGEARLKEARAAARAYADIHGPIPVKDAKGKRALGYVLSERTHKPTIEEIERATMAKGAPLTIAELKALYKTKLTTTFKPHVPEDVDESQQEEEIRRQLAASIEAAREGQERVAEAAESDTVPF